MNNQRELYRQGSLGTTLIDSLDDLVSTNRISPQLAMRILQNFDRVMPETLKKVKDQARHQFAFKGKLHTYRYCDDVWTFVLKNVQIRLRVLTFNAIPKTIIIADKLKIVCRASKPGEQSGDSELPRNTSMI